jgi:hypothetical protein
VVVVLTLPVWESVRVMVTLLIVLSPLLLLSVSSLTFPVIQLDTAADGADDGLEVIPFGIALRIGAVVGAVVLLGISPGVAAGVETGEAAGERGERTGVFVVGANTGAVGAFVKESNNGERVGLLTGMETGVLVERVDAGLLGLPPGALVGVRPGDAPGDAIGDPAGEAGASLADRGVGDEVVGTAAVVGLEDKAETGSLVDSANAGALVIPAGAFVAIRPGDAPGDAMGDPAGELLTPGALVARIGALVEGIDPGKLVGTVAGALVVRAIEGGSVGTATGALVGIRAGDAPGDALGEPA